MAEERLVEGPQVVVVLGRQLRQHIRVAADGALAEDHQVAREDVGALDGDEDRRALPGAGQVVVRAHDDALAAVHVHGVADALTAALGEVVLENRRQYRRFLAQVDGIGGEDARAVHQPGVAADAREGFLNAFEGGQRHVELLAQLGVLAGGQAGELGGAGADGRQRDGTTDRQAVHQHHPALTDAFLPTDQVIHGDEYVCARVGTVHECSVEREVASPDVDTLGVGGNQRKGNAKRLFVAEQVVRVIGLEGQAEHGGNRAQGDVALLPSDAQAQHLFAVELPFADNALVGHGAGIRAGIRRSQGKAGDVFATRQARQIVLFLLLGVVILSL